MMNRTWSFKILSIFIILAMTSMSYGEALTASKEFGGYYTKVNSGEEFEKYSRTGDYADIIVDLGSENGKFVFWRGSSYLPYWETSAGKWFVEELIPRKGDGPEGRPDKVNTYSRIALIESNAEQTVVHWRYLPEFSGLNPHLGVDQTKFVDEYFIFKPNGEVTRTCKKGTERIDAWRDSLNKITQTFHLTANGIADVNTTEANRSDPTDAIPGRPRKAAGHAPVFAFSFDEGRGNATKENSSGDQYDIKGHKSLWRKGVSGTALQLDGYNSMIQIPGEKGPKPTTAITLEAWVVIGAYPWSDVPIIQQADDVPEEISEVSGYEALLIGEEGRDDYEQVEEETPEATFKVTFKKENDTGYFFGLNGYGNPVLKLRVGGVWQELYSDVHLERRTWYHVAASFDGATGEMKLYVDGEPAGEKTVAPGSIELSAKDVKIGQGKTRRPMNPVRRHTFQDYYSIDGLLDEIRVHDVALSGEEISGIVAAYDLSDGEKSSPQMDTRVLPDGEDRGEFGAYYSHLKFYDVWDNLWRFSGHPDVVVEFDESPAKFVFWRGVGYIPMMVNENGQWYSNEFNETWNRSGGQGCQEPMSDKESYTNHVRIIENTPARTVVHWRYPLVDVLHVLANVDEDQGWGDWSDWYYYIYPDGVAVKLQHLWTHGERDHEWQESMAIFGPDQHPEQIIETEGALTMINMKGKSKTYDWVNGPPDGIEEPSKRIIQHINYKAEYDPVTIGKFVETNVYGGEITPYAVFPTWNHWPVSQMPSDGRYASFPDRTAHSSLSHVFYEPYAEDHGITPYEQKILMEGMLKADKAEMLDLAKSWMKAPAIKSEVGCINRGYDETQRAYMLRSKDKTMSFKLKASKKSPVVNPAFVIKNWNSDEEVDLTLNGKDVQKGKDFRQGVIRDTDGSKTLIVWIKTTSKRPVQIKLSTSRNFK